MLLEFDPELKAYPNIQNEKPPMMQSNKFFTTTVAPFLSLVNPEIAKKMPEIF